MSREVKSVYEIDTKELDQELIARGAQTPEDVQFKFKDPSPHPERDAFISHIKELYRTAPPPNTSLIDMNDFEIERILIVKNEREIDATRGIDDISCADYFDIPDEKIRKNTECVVAIFPKDCLTAPNKGYYSLNTRNYGKTFNLSFCEPFRDQTIIAGRMCTGFLISDDVIATYSDFIDEHNVTNCRVVFDYKMLDSYTCATQFTDDLIYHGVKILYSQHLPESPGKGLILIKLDRKVKGRKIAVLSKEDVYRDQECYCLGYPLGLPLKCSGDGIIKFINGEPNFDAYIKIYAGNSGSPVFDFYNHEVIGMSIESIPPALRYTGKGWMSFCQLYKKKVACTPITSLMNLPFN